MTDKTKGAIALAAGAAVLLIAFQAQPIQSSPAPVALTVGATATTTDALDCYGSEPALRHVINARRKWDEDDATFARYSSLIGGTTLGADDRLAVLAVNGDDVEVRVLDDPPDQVWRGIECWVNAQDAASVTR